MYLGEGEYVAAGGLVDLKEFYAGFHDVQRIDHQGYPVQEVRLGTDSPGVSGLDEVVELLFVGAWYNVPYLARAFVVIIEGIDIEVFHVPAERGELHADVDPGRGHPTDFLVLKPRYLQQRLLRLVGVVQIEQVRVVLELRVPTPALGRRREPTTVFDSGQVRCILNLHFLVLIYIDQIAHIWGPTPTTRIRPHPC